MGISLDGLASGLDTTALISSIMQVEAIPQTLLKNKSSRHPVHGVRAPGAQHKSRRPRDPGHGRGQARCPRPVLRNHQQRQGRGHHHCRCHRQAPSISRSPSWRRPRSPSRPSQRRSRVALHHHDHQQRRPGRTPITPLTSNLDDVVTAVNAAGAGVTASKVAVGGGEFRLQFTATKSGECRRLHHYRRRHHLHRCQDRPRRRNRTLAGHRGGPDGEVIHEHLRGPPSRRIRHRQGSNRRPRDPHRCPRRRRHHQAGLRTGRRRQRHLLLRGQQDRGEHHAPTPAAPRPPPGSSPATAPCAP